MDKRYAEMGYITSKSTSVRELNQCALVGLQELLGVTSSVDLATIQSSLVELFQKDDDEYFGLFKAFANSPIIQEYSCNKDVISSVQSLGVKFPTLVTPPILHVVGNGLIANKEKVFTPPHQDVVSTKGSIGQVVVWVPLHDIAANNYGIEVWPGSHRFGQLPIDSSEFGHTVKKELLPKSDSAYVSLQDGEYCIFSQYLIHKTHTVGNFRLAVSFRFNDLMDIDWKRRKYFTSFGRTADLTEYKDGRHLAPKQSQNYFE